MSDAPLPPDAFGHPAFARVAAALARHAGLKIPAHRAADLEAAARRDMARARLTDPDAYADRIASGHLPLADLVSHFTVGETYFFRDPPQFELLRTRIVPELLRARPPRHVLRAWSAGCASGEEAYSLAFAFEQLGLGDAWHVLGTDISRPALARARAGRYGDWSVRGPARDAAARRLERHPKQWHVPAAVRARVRFEYLNLAEDAYPSVLNATSGLDVILCRNVFIYFERAVVAAVARRLHAALAPGGWLLTGLSDPPLAQYAPLESVSTPAGVVYRRPDGAVPPRPAPPPLEAPRPAPPLPAAALAPPAPALRPGPEPAAPAEPVTAPAPADAPPASGLDAARAAFGDGDWASGLLSAPALLDTADGAALAVRAAANSGDLPRAEQLAAESVARFPLVPELHLLRAATLTELGREADALAAARRALYLDRNLAMAHATVAGLLGHHGDAEGARRAWRNVRRLCEALPPEAPVPLADGQCAGRVSEIASAQLSLLGGDPET